jgi:hypothetical protein
MVVTKKGKREAIVSDRAGFCCAHEERLRRVVQNEVAFLRMAVQELRRPAQEIP